MGVIPFTLLWELMSIEFPDQTTLLLGVCFLLIVYAIPNGITGLIEDIWHKRGRADGSLPGALQRLLNSSAASVKNLLQRGKSNA